MKKLDDPKVVLVHDWLTGMRGGEKCLELACGHWPAAPLFTLLHQVGSVSAAIENRSMTTSFLQRLPLAHRYYRYLLPLMPFAIRTFRLPRCELVLSFSHCVAKGIQPPPGAMHICYCFTPMRYAWHMRSAYFAHNKPNTLRSLVTDVLLEQLGHWDRASASRVDHFIAISRTVQRRISECYHRNSTVIYPPVDTVFYCPVPVQREDYYLIVSAFAPYKRLDLAIEACNRLKKKLAIIGMGQSESLLRSRAGETIHFLGWQSNEVVRDHLRRCRALLFPGEEDFGIVPVEAQACGTPVIAYGKGGATETVIPLESHQPPTGLFFSEPSAESLIDAMVQFESQRGAFSPVAARRQALRFQSQRYCDELFGFLRQVLQGPASVPQRRAA
jgi:glycosyltransferase involved in cell wall biosynthesis